MSKDKKIKNKKETLNKTHGEKSNIFFRDFTNQFHLAENNFIICNVLERVFV